MLGVEDVFHKRLMELVDEEKEKGMSYKGMAKKAGISFPTFLAYRRGEYMPSLAVLYDMCKTFGWSADWLLGLKDGR